MWWGGVGALAVCGAALAARRPASAVANLDEEDLESARIATLGVGGGTPKENQSRVQGFLGFLSGNRKNFNDGKFGELELLTGLVREDADTAGSLNRRFQINYDTRSRGGPKKSVRAGGTTAAKGATAWRSKNPQTNLYGGRGYKK